MINPCLSSWLDEDWMFSRPFLPLPLLLLSATMSGAVRSQLVVLLAKFDISSGNTLRGKTKASLTLYPA